MWRGPAGTQANWFDAANWTGRVPQDGDNAYLDNGGIAAINSGTTRQPRVLVLGSTSSGYISVDGGNANFSWINAGVHAGAYGQVTLISGGINTGDCTISNMGQALFEVRGGAANISGYFTIGSSAGSSGRVLVSSGSLSESGTYSSTTIGYNGTGLMNVSGGDVFMKSVSLGGFAGGVGTWQMSGGTATLTTCSIAGTGTGTMNLDGGALTATTMLVGTGSGSGKLVITAGNHSLDHLEIGSKGQVIYSGGTLSLGSMTGGPLDFANSSTTLTVSDFADFSAGFANSASATIHAGPNSMVFLPAGFDVNSQLREFTSSGLVHTVGSPLLIPDTFVLKGAGVINDFTEIRGTVAVKSGRSMTFGGGIAVHGGTIENASATVVASVDSEITSGTLNVGSLGVGSIGGATFRISGGQVGLPRGAAFQTTGWIGTAAGISGTLTIEGGDVNFSSLNVGTHGAGTVVQTGGQVTVPYIGQGYAVTLLGNSSDGAGRYELHGGTFTTGDFVIGGSSSLLVAGGTANTADTKVWSMGNITVDSGTLEAKSIAAAPGATITQNGGMIKALMYQTGSGAKPVYALANGNCTSDSIQSLDIRQSGGSIDAKALVLCDVTISGGTLHAMHGTISNTVTQSGGLAEFGLFGSSPTRYSSSGGTLRVDGRLYSGGAYDFTGANGTMDFPDGASIWLAPSEVLNAGNASFHSTPNTVLITSDLPSLAAKFGTFDHQGLTHVPGGILTIPSGRNIQIEGSFPDFVNVQGSLSGWWGWQNAMSLLKGVNVSGDGQVDLHDGQLVLESPSSISGGLIKAKQIARGSGSSVFTQSGGTVQLTDTFDAGTYNMSAGRLEAPTVKIGAGQQTGGDIVCTTASIAFGFTLTDGTISANTGSLWQFVQNGGRTSFGTTTINGEFGTIIPFLLQGGEFTTNLLSVGTRSSAGDTARFNQSGGQATVTLAKVGDTKLGIIELSGGIMDVGREEIGGTASGTLKQSGGTHNIGTLFMNANGRVELSGGVLAIGESFSATGGSFDMMSQPSTVTATGAILDFSNKLPVNASKASLVIDNDSLVLVPAGTDLGSVFGSSTGSGLIHQVGQPLTIPSGQTIRGGGTISDFVTVNGSLIAKTAISLSRGLAMGATTVNLGGGDLTVNTDSSVIQGTLTTGTMTLGKSSPANLVQTGGSVTVSNALTLTSGRYELHGGQLQSASMSGAASFLNDGGQQSVLGAMQSNDYELSGNGRLEDASAIVKSFRHVLGTHLVAGELKLSDNTCEYRMTDGLLQAGSITLTSGARFTQQAGQTIVTGKITAGTMSYTGSFADTLIQINGGQLRTGECVLQGYFGRSMLTLGSQAELLVTGKLTMGYGANLVADPGSRIRLEGADWACPDFIGPSLSKVNLIIDGGQDVTRFEVSGLDVGATDAGWSSNAAIDRLTLGDQVGGEILLVNENHNVLETSSEALYVDQLVLGRNASIDLNGLNLYYRNGGQPKRFIPCDADLDGTVGFGDYLILEAGFGNEGGLERGDFNGDKRVDFNDYLMLEATFGTGSQAVPEPTTALTMAVLTSLTLWRRERRVKAGEVLCQR